MTTNRNAVLSVFAAVFAAVLLFFARPAQACGPYEVTPEMEVTWAVEGYFYTAWHEQKKQDARARVHSVHFVGDIALATVELSVDDDTRYETVVVDKNSEKRWEVSSRIPLPRPAREALSKR